jgi:Protein of unknown function (DUF3037)
VSREPFQYAVVRIVPRIERGEFVNAGVILFCRTRGFLEVRIELDEDRLAALAADIPLSELGEHLEALVQVGAGDASAGAVASLPQSERFHWLVAPSSTVIQTSPVHSGLCEDPAETLERLVRELVLAPGG